MGVHFFRFGAVSGPSQADTHMSAISQKQTLQANAALSDY